MAGKKGRSGPRKGQMNALTNGSRLDPRRLRVGELPKKMIAVKREALAYRRVIEAEVTAQKGSISITAQHYIDTAAAATLQAGICRWLMRHRMEEMSASEIRANMADQVKAKERRNAAVEALELDWDDAGDVFETLYSTPVVHDVEEDDE